jgi:hypothetical protein
MLVLILVGYVLSLGISVYGKLWGSLNAWTVAPPLYVVSGLAFVAAQ